MFQFFTSTTTRMAKRCDIVKQSHRAEGLFNILLKTLNIPLNRSKQYSRKTGGKRQLVTSSAPTYDTDCPRKIITKPTNINSELLQTPVELIKKILQGRITNQRISGNMGMYEGAIKKLLWKDDTDDESVETGIGRTYLYLATTSWGVARFVDMMVTIFDDEQMHKIQRISLTGFPAQSVGSSNTDVLDSPCLLVLITGTSQSRQHAVLAVLVTRVSQSKQHESRKPPTKSLFDVGSRRISIVTVNTKEYYYDVLAIISRIMRRTL
ncbi:hypothetical protein Tco_0529862 [Tanacetum coccineum]